LPTLKNEVISDTLASAPKCLAMARKHTSDPSASVGMLPWAASVSPDVPVIAASGASPGAVSASPQAERHRDAVKDNRVARNNIIGQFLAFRKGKALKQRLAARHS